MSLQPGSNDVKSRRACPAAMRTLGFAAVLLLAGCSRFGSPALQFSPAMFPDCEDPNIVVHVSWDATGVTTESITIQVYKPGHAPTVWYKGPPKGQRDTGKWMADGSTMRLLDSQGRLLAMRTLQTTPCK